MLNVNSETSVLRRVLVHEPGVEVDQMVPTVMDELLFDDVIYGERARQEHALFRRVLRYFAVDVVDSGQLLTEALQVKGAVEWLKNAVNPRSLPGVQKLLDRASVDELADILVAGRRSETPAQGVEVGDLFDVSPLPNWCFQRDPQVVLGTGVIFCSMATGARAREALLSRAIFKFHPHLRCHVHFEPQELEEEAFLEGGDVVLFSPEVLAVGLSARTNQAAWLGLGKALARKEDGPRWLLGVELPQRRAYMHLDTVITPIDLDAALVYPPVVQGEGRERARVMEIDLHADDPAPVECEGDLLAVLARKGVDMKPVPCGGADPLSQQREQWTDGANALAIRPGVIVIYERNSRTCDELVKAGYRVVAAEDLMVGKEEVDPHGSEKVCFLISGNELSRARGGPHCLTHPLVRDPV